MRSDWCTFCTSVTTLCRFQCGMTCGGVPCEDATRKTFQWNLSFMHCSRQLSHFGRVRCDWSQPRRTGSLHSARPSYPWLRPIVSVLCSSDGLRSVEMRSDRAAVPRVTSEIHRRSLRWNFGGLGLSQGVWGPSPP